MQIDGYSRNGIADMDPVSPGPGRTISRLMVLAVPIILSLILQMAGGVMDAALASRADARILVAITVGGTLEALPIAFVTGLVFAVVPAIGEMKASKRSDKIKTLLARALTVSVLLAVIFAAVVLAYAKKLLSLVGLQAELVADLTLYLAFVPVFILGNVLFILGRTFVEAYSRPWLVTIAVLAGLAAKGAAIVLLVFGGLGLPALGLVGFALSSVVYYIAINAVLFGICLRNRAMREIRLRPVTRSDLSPRQLWAFARAGLPIGFNYLSDLIVITMMSLSVAAFDTVQAAAHSLAFNVLGLSLVVTGGIAMASSIMVAQARSVSDAATLRSLIQTCLATALAAIAAMAALVMSFPGRIVAIYAPQDELVQPSLRLLGVLPILLILLTLSNCCEQAFKIDPVAGVIGIQK